MELVVHIIGIENVNNAIVVICLTMIAFVYLFLCEVSWREKQPMSSNEQKIVVAKNSIGFFGIMFIILFLLKVGVVETVVMGWSWWLITIPIWGPVALVIAFFLACLIIGLLIGAIAALVELIIKKRKEKARIRRIAEDRAAREARQNQNTVREG